MQMRAAAASSTSIDTHSAAADTGAAAVATTAPPSSAVQRSVAVLERLFAGYAGDGFDVRLWDGATWRPNGGEEPRFTIVLRHEGSLRAMLWPPGELTLSEAYVHGDFDLEGDLEAVFPLADLLLAERRGRGAQLALARQLHALPAARRERPSGAEARLRGRRHSLERDRAAVEFHYGRSNEFFAAFLDPRLVYSCAYFATEDDDLATAQERKLDLVCRKLRLERGDRLLDVGCGWGALVLHAAERYGVDALGVTLSEAQAELARGRIRAAGLEGRCRVEVRDYRELEGETFDKVASIGMFEHVGEELLPEYFARVRDALRPGGVFLNHGIARPVWRGAKEGSSFIE